MYYRPMVQGNSVIGMQCARGLCSCSSLYTLQAKVVVLRYAMHTEGFFAVALCMHCSITCMNKIVVRIA